MTKRLIEIFEKSNSEFLTNDIGLIVTRVSERTLCGALSQHLARVINNSEFSSYYVDVEYNRNRNGTVKTHLKTIKGLREEVIRINCDLIVHSRGNNIQLDNLIAIEMKKSNRPQVGKDSDRYRLMALTKDSYDDVWSFDGTTLPEHVCRYCLGVYYEINLTEGVIEIEYYQKGHIMNKKQIDIKKI